jgi:zinc transport system substrate-binding protein
VFLADSLVTLAVDAQIVTLLDASEMVLWPMRRSGVWSAPHDADSDEDGLSQAHDRAQGEAGPDPHVWLDPTNAQSMTAAIVAALQTVDPANSEAYAVNGAAVIARLARLERQMESALAPVRAAPFVVFHDAYQYLERRFYLQALGAITIGPEVQPGAARIRDTQLLIRSRDARCVFAEPQFEPQIVRVVIEGTTVPWGVLDPLGENLVAGPDLYVQLMERMTNAVVACLSTP